MLLKFYGKIIVSLLLVSLFLSGAGYMNVAPVDIVLEIEEFSFKCRHMIGHWLKDEVDDMGARMVRLEVDSDLFNPDQVITRAESVTFLMKALGLRPSNEVGFYHDVDGDETYGSYFETAFHFGLLDEKPQSTSDKRIY